MIVVMTMIVLIRLIGFGLFSDCSWHKLFPNNYAAKIEQAQELQRKIGKQSGTGVLVVVQWVKDWTAVAWAAAETWAMG